jgi:eukaryotic-like serine/threonine-protein kinase
MAGNPRVLELLEEMLDSGQEPEEVCRDCPELLAEVRQRWQAFRRIDTAVGALFPEPGTPSAVETHTPEPPIAGLPQIPGYEVEAVLGQGGMGVVYKARHLRLNRVVALKMLLAGAYAGRHELVRFQREAETLASLRHPNIVQVYDVADHAGRPYFTMEYIEGGNLARKLAGTPLPARRAAELTAILAEAVEAAHQSGVIHRDLKPGNVLLTADGSLKITDFGLARRVESGPEFTLSGARLGTLSYMAPEQALGKSSAMGPPADLYALGAILYELLTGRPPFRAETATETERQVIAEDPALPTRLNAKVPRDLETICLKCLHKSPARRYANAQDLADDLRRFLDGKSIRGRRVGVFERAVKWARKRPAAVLLVVALLILSGAALWLLHLEADRQAAKAQREEKAQRAIEMALGRAKDLRREERWREALDVLKQAATHLTEAESLSLQERLEKEQSDLQLADELERVRGNSPMESDAFFFYIRQEKAFRQAFERAGLEIGDDPKPVATFIGSSAIRDQLLAAIEDWAIVAAINHADPLVRQLLRVTRVADPEPRWRDRFRDSTIWWSREELLRLADNAFNTTPPPTEHQLALLGWLLRRVGAMDQSTRLLGEACRRQPNNFWLNREMGTTLHLDGRNLESATYFRVALALRPDSPSAYGDLGKALFDAGQIEDALAAFRRAVELSPAGFSTPDFLVSPLAATGHWTEAADECRRAMAANPRGHRSAFKLGLALWNNQKDEDAIPLFRQAIAVGNRDVNPYLYLGQACSRIGQHDQAATALRGAVALIPSDPTLRELLARELCEIGQKKEAIVELQQAIVGGHSDALATASFHAKVGTLLRAQGETEVAVTAFQKATKLAPQFTTAWHGLATALLDQGRFAEARAATARQLKLPASETARRVQQRQLDLCDTLLPVAADLPAILAGQKQPPEATTQRALAEWCLKHGRRPSAAASYYAAVLLAKPSLVDDLEVGNRFDAACAAALAGSGIGEDSAKLEVGRREVWRRQALDWLTAEYDAWAERHRLGKPGDRTVVAASVRSWQQNEYLAGVRDEQALVRLPSQERRTWQRFWARVATLAARDPVVLFDRARGHVVLREWRKAAACYAEGIQLEPTDNAEIWFEYAATQLLAGDRSGYRKTCAQMLVRSRGTPFMRPYLVARACTLAPASVDDLGQSAQLSEAELQDHQTAFWSLTEQAALRLRAGKAQEAVRFSGAALAADGYPGRAMLNWLWLALAHKQLGQAAEARRWLDKATAWLDQQEGRMPVATYGIGMHYHNWLEAHVLRQEAEALLR